MKFVLLFVVIVSVTAELSNEADVKKEDLHSGCVLELLSSLAKPDAPPLQPDCKEVLRTGFIQTPPEKNIRDDVHSSEQDKNMHKEVSDVVAQAVIEELLNKNQQKHEGTDEERSQEEFPVYYKRHYILTSKERPEDSDDERSQEEFPSKRNTFLISGGRYEDTQRQGELQEEEEREKRRVIYKYRHRNNHKRDQLSKDEFIDADYDRSQEDFPSFVYERLTSGGSYKDSNSDQGQDKEEREKRRVITRYRHRNNHKRDSESSFDKPEDVDYDRSQEDFPSFVYKRHNSLLSGGRYKDLNNDQGLKELAENEEREKRRAISRYRHRNNHKRDIESNYDDLVEPDYDRSQEDFPSFVYKRHNVLTGEGRYEESINDGGQDNIQENEEREKRRAITRHRHRNNHKRDIGTSMDELTNPDYDRSQEDFPSFVYKIESRYEDSNKGQRQEDLQNEREKRRAISRYRHRNNHKRDSESNIDELVDPDYDRSQEDFPSFVYNNHNFLLSGGRAEDQNNDQRQENLQEIEEREKRRAISRYRHRNNHKRDSESNIDELVDPDYDRSQEDFPSFVYNNHNFLLSGGRAEDQNNDQRQENLQETEEREKRRANSRYRHRNNHKRDSESNIDELVDPDYDRSQEDFPSFVYNNHNFLLSGGRAEDQNNDQRQENLQETEEREKRRAISRYRHRNNHKRDSESNNNELVDPDYDRSQEDFPSFVYKRLTNGGRLEGSNNDRRQEELLNEEREKRRVISKYRHRNNHKRDSDSSEEDKRLKISQSLAELSPLQKLELANALQYKMGLSHINDSTDGEKDTLHQITLTSG